MALGLNIRGENLFFSYKCANINAKCCIGHMVAAVPYGHTGSHACTCFCSVPTMWHKCALTLGFQSSTAWHACAGTELAAVLEVALVWPLRGIAGHVALHSSKAMEQAHSAVSEQTGVLH